MRKIRLQLDALTVTSFETAAARAERGTVAAHQHQIQTDAVDCEITAGINSCWCSEYDTCYCTWDCSWECAG